MLALMRSNWSLVTSQKIPQSSRELASTEIKNGSNPYAEVLKFFHVHSNKKAASRKQRCFRKAARLSSLFNLQKYLIFLDPVTLFELFYCIYQLIIICQEFSLEHSILYSRPTFHLPRQGTGHIIG